MNETAFIAINLIVIAWCLYIVFFWKERCGIVTAAFAFSFFVIMIIADNGLSI